MKYPNQTKPIGSDFEPETVTRKGVKCSECSNPIGIGQTALVSKRGGVVQKRVCGEDCRLEFDARFWENMSRKRRSKQ